MNLWFFNRTWCSIFCFVSNISNCRKIVIFWTYYLPIYWVQFTVGKRGDCWQYHLKHGSVLLLQRTHHIEFSKSSCSRLCLFLVSIWVLSVLSMIYSSWHLTLYGTKYIFCSCWFTKNHCICFSDFTGSCSNLICYSSWIFFVYRVR